MHVSGREEGDLDVDTDSYYLTPLCLTITMKKTEPTRPTFEKKCATNRLFQPGRGRGRRARARARAKGR